ncbi:MAG: PAS domain S-box protein [Ginsengibacter sp.]
MISVAPELLNPTFDKAIIKTNSEGTITEWCINAENFLGYSAGEIIGQDISRIFPNEYLLARNNPDADRKNNGKAFYKVTARTKLDQKILVSMEHSSIKNEDGAITGFSITLQYISGESILEEKEAIIEAIVNSSDDGIISKTLEGIITSWNPAASRMFGYLETEVIGKHISIIIPPDRLQEEDFIIGQIMAGNKIDHFETVRVAKDGTENIIELSISPIKAKNGQVIGISKILRDISFKKEIELKQAMLAAIVDSSDDAIISKTIDGIITSWNHSATNMFGFSAEEAIGKHISIIIPPERLEEETVIIENIRNGKKVDHFETIRISKDGTKKNISVTISPIKNNKGIIIGASKTARDISIKAEAERQRDLYTQRLKELNQYKDEFMVMASHELKTPLTVILANLEILKMLMENHPNNNFVEKSFNQTLKLSNLINNLFEVSKIQAGKLTLDYSSFDMNELVDELIGDIQQTTNIHRIIFHPTPGISVTADHYKMQQVIINLLSNSIKYMTSPGDIILKIDKRNDEVIFSVKDEGIGIPKFEIDKIFQRFYRVSGSASSFSGSGVGLYISSEIIKAHNGKLWAESEIEKGSTFYFSIPCM